MTWDALRPALLQGAMAFLAALSGVGGTIGVQKLIAAPPAPAVAPVPTSVIMAAPAPVDACLDEMRRLRTDIQPLIKRAATPRSAVTK